MKKVYWTLHLKILLGLFLLSSPLYGKGMQKNLEKAFEVLGMANNITEGGGYQDQRGGFYTGGSIFARSKANNAEIFSLQMPHPRAGCGGIDLFLGGFSYINAQEFIQLLRNIGSNAAGYAFSLALSTVTPLIKSNLDGLLARVQEMTNQNINSCEAGATLMGAVWPQSDKSSAILCNAMGNSYGKVSDWVQSRQKCGAKGEREATNAEKNNVPGFQDMLGDEFNIAWNALKKNSFLGADNDLAEFFMTISGTIISQRLQDKRDKKYRLHFKYYPSQSSDPNLISALIEGKQPAQIYRCDNHEPDKCLNPRLSQPFTLGDKALAQKISTLLHSIKERLWENTKALTGEEQDFVNSTMIPILKIMAVEMAFKQGSPITISSYQDAIAHDILLQYLDEVMELVWNSVTQLKQVQVNDGVMKEFRTGIEDTRKHLFAERTKMFEQISLTLEAIERTHQIELKLQNMFISQQQGTRQ
ncbi:MAG: conjugal transfer protein TraH [Alphaproteobacteria bacterium]|nr:conjugal transfer protein TraH [Alphaproteobacteria bacterium]MBP9776248.1 conjugal transfer protein TraH [Alphaproteobacteria bacterium]